MTRERIVELDLLATNAIAECYLTGQAADHATVAFWPCVMSAVDDLKADVAMVKEH